MLQVKKDEKEHHRRIQFELNRFDLVKLLQRGTSDRIGADVKDDAGSEHEQQTQALLFSQQPRAGHTPRAGVAAHKIK